jgi:glycerate dehydrogenase
MNHPSNPAKPAASFLDFATVGPGIDTGGLDRLVQARYHDYSDPEEVAERLEACEIALLNKARLGREEIEAAAELKLIVLAATGCDNVDIAAARDAGIAVANVREYCASSLAQHVFALILGLTQKVGPYDSLVRSGVWSRSRSFALFDYPIRELAGRTLGIVGYGALGQAVGRIGESFGMQLLIAQRPGSDEPPPAGRLPLATVLAEADVLSLHCPLTEVTRHLLDAAAFRTMKRDALVINTARGALIDQQALADALRTGRIGGAGIDVLPLEPPPADHPLLKRDIPNLILTPHIAWAAQEARQRAIDQVAENIEAWLGGRTLRRIV